MRDRRSGLLLLALCGCVDVTRPFERQIEPVVRREAALREAAERARVEALPHVLDDAMQDVRRVSVEGDVEHLLVGGARADVLRDGRVVTGREVPASPILQAAKGARGWIFATDDAVYASETFTGPLRLLRLFPTARRPESGAHELSVVLHPGHERVAVTFDYAENYVSDGLTLRRIDVPPTRSMAWFGERHGARIDTSLRVHTTHDGGATWGAIDLRGEGPVRVEAREAGLVLVTAEGTRRIGDDDALVPVPADGDMDRSRCAGNHDFARLRAALVRAYERAPGFEHARSPRPDGGAGGVDLPVEVALPNRVEAGEEHDRFAFPHALTAPLGTLLGRVFVTDSTEPATVTASLLSAVPPSPGRRVDVAWRASDERGGFTRRVQLVAPREAVAATAWEARWLVVGATRAGALVRMDVDVSPVERAPGEESVVEQRLYWLSARGARPVALPEPYGIEGFVALEDGGAVVLFNSSHANPRCDLRPDALSVDLSGALQLAPDGAELRRVYVGVAPSLREVVGFGRQGATWGVVVGEHGHDAALTLVTAGGVERPFGVWRHDAQPRACGVTAPDAPRLHLFNTRSEGPGRSLDARFYEETPDAEAFEPREGVFERDARGVCVRAVMAVSLEEGYEDRSENGDVSYGTLRLFARDGALVGTYDDGRSIAPVRAELKPAPAEPSHDI